MSVSSAFSKSLSFCFLATFLPVVLALFSRSEVLADPISSSDVVAISNASVGSGNGTLDLRMITFSGSEIDNNEAGFNGDNANTEASQGGGVDTGDFDESYFTTALEIKDFYRLNFPDGMGGSTVSELALFVDLNESAGGTNEAMNSLDFLEIILNPDTVNGNPDPSGDLTGAEQNAIDQMYTLGTDEASLVSPPFNLPILEQGAGFADYIIFTGIDPFSLNDSDQLLINVSMSVLSDGAEEVFLSGEFAPQDILPIPEPSQMALGLGMFAGLLLRRRKQ